MYVVSICSVIELMAICSSKSIYEIQMTNSEAQHRAKQQNGVDGKQGTFLGEGGPVW